MNINLWAAFGFLGLFTILSINAIRSYISEYAESKGFVFGIFYGGIAIFSALGAVTVGYIWKIYGFNDTVLFSELGMSIMFITLLLKQLLF